MNDMLLESAPQTAERKASKRGFTLTEIAIVLGIIGLILGAIWVAASAVYNNLRTSKATTELLQITQSIRALYATSSTTGDAAGTDETATMRQASVFPSDMVNGAVVSNPWTGTVMVTSQTFANAGDAIGIEFNTVPTAACISLLSANTGSGRDSGLIYANAQAAAKGAAAVGYAANTLPIPVTAAAAAAAAVCAAAANVSVMFQFKLKG